MHLPWPVTLIGPRLSSVSIGWTIGLSVTLLAPSCPFVSALTSFQYWLGNTVARSVQLSASVSGTRRDGRASKLNARVVLFIARVILYGCLICWVLYLAPVCRKTRLCLLAGDMLTHRTNVWAIILSEIPFGTDSARGRLFIWIRRSFTERCTISPHTEMSFVALCIFRCYKPVTYVWTLMIHLLPTSSQWNGLHAESNPFFLGPRWPAPTLL